MNKLELDSIETNQAMNKVTLSEQWKQVKDNCFGEKNGCQSAVICSAHKQHEWSKGPQTQNEKSGAVQIRLFIRKNVVSFITPKGTRYDCTYKWAVEAVEVPCSQALI